ncbi:hypothetical protein AS29_010420 [Bacillus sp. SJS]|nr:hypothetical protein AS29_010420 [Bacillus sp. SJS]
MTHYHIASRVIAVLLFFAVYYLHNHGKLKLSAKSFLFTRKIMNSLQFSLIKIVKKDLYRIGTGFFVRRI